ncbi:MAG: radical SAM protein [archaeon]
MHEVVNKLNSLSLFVGTADCNARCKHCAGFPLRKYAPKEDGIIDEKLIEKTVRNCYSKGARYLSISSSGEPTLSPLAITKVMKLVHKLEKEGIKFSPINLYSNGIRIGEDRSFCKKYLPLWRKCGLKTIYITVHSVNEQKNAKIYGIKSYPSLQRVLSRIHSAGLSVRANLVLSKETIISSDDFISTIKHLIEIGVDYVSAWPIRSLDDKIDFKMSPSEAELNIMEQWIEKNNKFGNRVRLLREKNRGVYKRGEKLTLFPDGTLSNTWCN